MHRHALRRAGGARDRDPDPRRASRSRCATGSRSAIRQMPTISPQARACRCRSRARAPAAGAARRRALTRRARPSAQPRAHLQPISAGFGASGRRSHTFDVDVRVGEERQLKAARAAGPRDAPPADLSAGPRWRRATPTRRTAPPLAFTSTSPPSLRSSATDTPGGSAAATAAALAEACAASAWPRLLSVTSARAPAGPTCCARRCELRLVGAARFPTADSPPDGCSTWRVGVRTLTESALPHSSLIAGHALTLTLARAP